MKLILAVFCIVLLQGVVVNCQSSSLQSAINSVSSVYQQYQSGLLQRNLLSTARDWVSTASSYIRSAESFLNTLQLTQLPQLPQLPSIPQAPQLPQSLGRIQTPWRG